MKFDIVLHNQKHTPTHISLCVCVSVLIKYFRCIKRKKINNLVVYLDYN